MKRQVITVAALVGAALCLSAAVAFGWANYTTSFNWGDGGTTRLVDGGARYSNTVQLQNPVGGATCISNGTGVITLMGSNDGVNAIAIGSPIPMDGGLNVYGWDPINSGLEYVTIFLDGGVSTSGTISCSINQKGNTP